METICQKLSAKYTYIILHRTLQWQNARHKGTFIIHQYPSSIINSKVFVDFGCPIFSSSIPPEVMMGEIPNLGVRVAIGSSCQKNLVWVLDHLFEWPFFQSLLLTIFGEINRSYLKKLVLVKNTNSPWKHIGTDRHWFLFAASKYCPLLSPFTSQIAMFSIMKRNNTLWKINMEPYGTWDYTAGKGKIIFQTNMFSFQVLW